MGSGLDREHRSNNNETGLTEFNYEVPTLSICGTKDGLFRVTRAAENYFHQFLNIDPSQAGKYPIHVLEGGSHGSFMDEDILSKLVQSRDLKPALSQEDAHTEIGKKMVEFISNVRGDNKTVFNTKGDSADTFMDPIIEGMVMEGSYNIRIPCYDYSSINPDTPKRC